MNIKILVFILVSLMTALFLATVVSPWASSSPDGLEKVAHEKGFAAAAEDEPIWSVAPLADYAVAQVDSEPVATGLAGLIGTILVFAAAVGLARLLRTHNKTLPQ